MTHVKLIWRNISNGSILILEPGGTIVRSAVVTVSVAACDGVALGVTIDGETEQLKVAGALQVSVTCWENPPIESTLSEYVAVFPAGTEGVAVNELISKEAPVPVPDMEMV